MKFIILIFTLTLWMLTSAQPQNNQQNSIQARRRQEGLEREAERNGETPNSKFAGAKNVDEEARFNLRRRFFYRRRRPSSYYSDPCYRRRSARSQGQSRDNQGRFLWDLNVQNYYNQIPSVRPSYDPYPYSDDCAYYDGPGFGGGGGGLGQFLQLFSPGGQLNPRPGQTYRPQRPQRPQAPIIDGGAGDVDPGVDPQNPDDIFDPVYEDVPSRPLYDESPRPPTVGQLIGGVSNTVNDVIQNITSFRPGRGLVGDIIYEYGQLFRF